MLGFKKKVLALSSASALLFMSVVVGLAPTVNAAYNSSFLMSDYVFADGGYSQNDIQNFLASKNSYLARYSTVEDCGNPNGAHYSHYAAYYACGQTVQASKIISDAARAYNINPRVLIATMQKEQSLITAQNPSDSEINCAMGYLSCDSDYLGFFAQVDNGAWQFRTYIELMNGRNWWGYSPSQYPCSGATSLYSTGLYPGRTVTFYNPNGQARTVTLGSSATAALYCYTPHVGPYSETGYSGSYNFVYWYEQWFGPTGGSGPTISLDKGAGSPVALSFNADGKLELIGIAGNDAIYNRHQTSASSSSWSGWTQFPGGVRNISAETNVSGNAHMVGIAANGNIYYTAQSSNNSAIWDAWTQIDGALMASSVARNYNGTIEIIGVAPNGAIYHKRQNTPNSADWGAWAQIPGALKNIAADTNADGRIQLVGVTSNGSVYTTYQTSVNSTDWAPWTQLDGGLATAAIARNENGTLEIFGIASNGAIFRKRQATANGTSWGAWAQMTGGLKNIAAESNQDGRLQLVGVASNGSVYQASQTSSNSTAWSEWSPLDGGLRKY